ncbi:hypothetical protein [Wolbachia endosymbiont of Pentidionis agamae]|uniref:hypothetical protein n=1 Tax=Wolbachia endosymbiont of Pentidionis agamae TaxID=3110435 RepID=UPI002FD46903
MNVQSPNLPANGRKRTTEEDILYIILFLTGSMSCIGLVTAFSTIPTYILFPGVDTAVLDAVALVSLSVFLYLLQPFL